jgi:DNA-binding response OmpR family regulator
MLPPSAEYAITPIDELNIEPNILLITDPSPTTSELIHQLAGRYSRTMIRIRSHNLYASEELASIIALCDTIILDVDEQEEFDIVVDQLEASLEWLDEKGLKPIIAILQEGSAISIEKAQRLQEMISFIPYTQRYASNALEEIERRCKTAIIFPEDKIEARKYPELGPKPITRGPFTLDFATRTLFVDTVEIYLTLKELKFLELLITAEEPCSNAYLVTNGLGYEETGTRDVRYLVMKTISDIRRKGLNKGLSEKWIKSRKGIGYYLADPSA